MNKQELGEVGRAGATNEEVAAGHLLAVPIKAQPGALCLSGQMFFS